MLIQSSFGQTVFIQELESAKKLASSHKRDSLIVENLYQLTQIVCVKNEFWRDSLRRFGVSSRNRVAGIISEIRKADSEINFLNGKNGANNLLAIAKELESKKEYAYASFAYLRVGAIYNYILTNPEDNATAILYYNKAIALIPKIETQIDIARIYDYIGEYYLTQKNYQKAIANLDYAKKTITDPKYESILPTIYSSLAASYIHLSQIDLAQKNYNLSLEACENTLFDINPAYKTYVKHIFLNEASVFYYQKQDYNKSLKYALEDLKSIEHFSKAFGFRIDFENYKSKILESIHLCYHQLKNYQKAYEYLNLLEKNRVLLTSNSQIKEFNELNLKYQTEQNKRRISSLENENLRREAEKQQNLRYFLVFALIIFVGLTLFIYFSNLKLRSKNKEISEAMLKGQTIERKRVAADLHDNLGSTLSSIVFSLEAIDKTKMDVAEIELHRNLSQMLEKAYNDVRLLSHNLLPEEFEKQGLVPTLQSFVRKISKNSKIHFDLQIAERFGRVNNKIEFELYSICLELVNNIIKHSKATEAKIALSRTEKQIELIVSDNGIGTFKNDSDGKGMKNVKARVESLNGTWELKNIENQGVRNEISIPT